MADFFPKHQHSAIAKSKVKVPGIINYHNAFPEGSPLKAYFQSVEQKIGSLNERRTNVDPEKTYVGDMRECQRLGEAIGNDIGKSLTATRNSILANKAEIETNKLNLLNLKPSNSEEAKEMRAVIRQLPVAEREAMVRKAFADKDVNVMSAVVGIHEVLTGVRPEVVEASLDQFFHTNHPDMLAIVENNRKELELIDTFSTEFISLKPQLVYETEGFDKAAQLAREVASTLKLPYVGPEANPVPEMVEAPERKRKPALGADGKPYSAAAPTPAPEPSYSERLPAGAVALDIRG